MSLSDGDPAKERPLTSAADPSAAVPATGQVTRRQHQDLAVWIRYLDSTNHQLAEPRQIWGAFRSELHIPWQTIPGYLLYDIRHYQTQFLLNQAEIDLIYTKQLAAPLMVFHEDEAGQLLVPPLFIHGELNRRYNIEPLAQYRQDFVRVDHDPQGLFGQVVQQLHFQYRLTAGQRPIDLPRDNAVTMRQAKQAYLAPHYGQPLEWPLPAGSTWQIFTTIKNPRDHSIWFNLGGDLWIDSLNTQLRQHPHLPTQAPPTKKSRNLLAAMPFAVMTRDSTVRRGQIKASPSFPISQWTFPYGQVVAQRLADQTEVGIKCLLTLENGSQWVQLDSGYYIEMKYLLA
ncbi:MucBP domain-containing protein [Lapidilactobacillus salsurivasis]